MLRKAKSSKLVEWTRKPPRPPKKAGGREDLLGSWGAFQHPGPVTMMGTVTNPSRNARSHWTGSPRLLRDPKVTQEMRQGWDHSPLSISAFVPSTSIYWLLQATLVGRTELTQF